MFFRTLGVRVVVCGGGHRGWDCVLLLVGGRVDSWAGIARRGSVLLFRGGGNGIGNARRECASGVRFVVARVGSAGLALGVGIALVFCWCGSAGLQDCFIRLQDCFIRFQDCFIRFQDCFASRFQDCFA